MNSLAFVLISLSRLAHSVASAVDIGQLQIAPAETVSALPTALSSGIQFPAFDEIPFLLMPPQSSPPQQHLMMAYYPDWARPDFPPEKIDFGRFDWIDFAFAVPNKDLSLAWDDPEGSPQLLSRLVSAAHENNKKVKLSVGGWTGSEHFSSAVSSSQNRQLFAQNIANLYKQYQLDGIDIDWEYPGHQGAGNNGVSPSDTANFLLFLQLLRTILPQTAKISAAVLPTPFFDSTKNPMQDVSSFAKVLDWVTIMNYDVWGASANPGPNAPLSDNCRNSTQREASAQAAYWAWTNANFPASKLILGVPSYAYLSPSNATRLRQRASDIKLVSDDGDPQIQFCDLVEQGVLELTNASDSFGPLYTGTGGFVRYWDGCSNTPYLRSSSSQQVVTHDDPQSLGRKARFVRNNRMLGVNMFDVTGDVSCWHLTDALRRGLGLILSPM
ncbi:glycoside hydrolase [Mycena amicta]|nr:glycoside hydrolase [Mycena amicta]